MFICLSYVIKLLINLSGIFDYLTIWLFDYLTICPLYFVVQLDYLSILSLVEFLMNKIEICFTYFVELFKNWCKGSAGWTPVSWEVEGYDLFVGQGVLGLDLGAVKSKKFGAAKKLHDSIEVDSMVLWN